MIRLARVVLGPRLKTRSYGIMAATPDAPTDETEIGRLSSFILQARQADVEGRFAAFFPLDRTENATWALALVDSTMQGHDIVMHADALIFPRAVLDRIDWAVHRALSAWPVSAEHAAEPYDLNLDDFAGAIGNAEKSFSLRHVTGPAGSKQVQIHAQDRLSPIDAVKGVWELLPPRTRVNRAFCTSPEIAALVSAGSGRRFDIITTAHDPSPGGEAILFTRSGIMVPPSMMPGWLGWVTDFQQKFQKLARLSKPLPPPDDTVTDPAMVIHAAVEQALAELGVGQTPEVIGHAAQAGAGLPPDAIPMLRSILDARLDQFLKDFEHARGHAIEHYWEHASKPLEAPPALLGRIALDHKILFSLRLPVSEALSRALLESPSFTRQAAGQAFGTKVGKEQILRMGDLAVARLNELDRTAGSRLTPQQVEVRDGWFFLLCSILEAFGRRSDTETERLIPHAHALVARDRRSDIVKVVTALEGSDAAWRKVKKPADVKDYNAARDARRVRPTKNPAQLVFDAIKEAIEQQKQPVTSRSFELDLALVTAR